MNIECAMRIERATEKWLERCKGEPSLEPAQAVENAIMYLIKERPLYGEVLSILPRVEVAAGTPVRVMFSDNRHVLIWDPRLMGHFPTPATAALLEREAIHLLLDHDARRGNRDSLTWAIASDMVAGSLVEGELPQTCVNLKDVPEFESHPDPTTEEVHDVLQEKHQSFIDAMRTMCCNAAAHTIRAPSTTKWYATDFVMDALHHAVGCMPEGQKLPPQIAEVIRKKIHRPGWEQGLLDFATACGRTRKTTSQKRLDRRTGKPPGRARRPNTHLVVALDTSASLSTATLEKMIGLLMELVESTRVSIRLLMFDSEVRHDVMITPDSNPLTEVVGRTTTDLNAPFKYLSETDEPCDGLIVITDGKSSRVPRYTDAPATLWAITEGGRRPVDWGWMINL